MLRTWSLGVPYHFESLEPLLADVLDLELGQSFFEFVYVFFQGELDEFFELEVGLGLLVQVHEQEGEEFVDLGIELDLRQFLELDRVQAGLGQALELLDLVLVFAQNLVLFFPESVRV